jgi:hypothetical protein
MNWKGGAQTVFNVLNMPHQPVHAGGTTVLVPNITVPSPDMSTSNLGHAIYTASSLQPYYYKK